MKKINSDLSKEEDTSHPHQSEMDFHKSIYDYLKHLSTLSTGSILLLAAFLEKLFQQPSWKGLVAVAISGFLITVISSVVTYSILVLNFPRSYIKTTEWEEKLVAGGILVTWVGFITWVVSLAAFVIRNMA